MRLAFNHLCNSITPVPTCVKQTACLAACPCLQHDESEYGSFVNKDGTHSGGPFTIKVSGASAQPAHRSVRV